MSLFLQIIVIEIYILSMDHPMVTICHRKTKLAKEIYFIVVHGEDQIQIQAETIACVYIEPTFIFLHFTTQMMQEVTTFPCITPAELAGPRLLPAH